MLGLSLKQPWAQLVVAGMPVTSGKVVLKDIENRSWPLPLGFKVPQRVYIHAAQKFDNEALICLMEMGFAPFASLCMFSRFIPRGAIVGEVDIVGCVTKSESPWFVGPYGFQLVGPQVYEKPIPYKGRLGLFEVKFGDDEAIT